VHEYSLVAALIERVEAEVAAHRAARVHRVHVCIGELAGVEIELFRTAYETFREGSILTDAELTVRPAEARWECPTCGGAIARGERLSCPACRVPARLSQGDEILLERIEMEVPDV
jgi:hydrogenase nickel incorporation protein HypA/HybF